MPENLIITTCLKLKIMPLEQYNGSGNPEDHILTYNTTIRLHLLTKPLLCMTFPTTLRKVTRDWFNGLVHGSIYSFHDLAYTFYNQFAASVKRKKNPTCLLSITQKKGEKLRDYIQHFNTKRLEVGDCSDNVAVPDLTNALKCMELVRTLYLTPLEDFDDIMDRTKDYMVV